MFFYCYIYLSSSFYSLNNYFLYHTLTLNKNFNKTSFQKKSKILKNNRMVFSESKSQTRISLGQKIKSVLVPEGIPADKLLACCVSLGNEGLLLTSLSSYAPFLVVGISSAF